MQIRSSKRMQRPLPNWFWGVPLVLLVGVALLIAFGPEERTLGQGIRSVYLHVGLIWTGLMGFGVTAVLGIGVLLTEKPFWLRWFVPVSWVALGFYAAGVFMSMVASADNWGAVFLQEPRMAASLNGLAVATILLVLGSWQPWPRVRGALGASIIFVLLWFNFSAELVLHPQNPITNSEATPIQLTFLLVTTLFVLLAGWVVWLLRFAKLK
ncbi:MAG: hypothetical protein H6657_16600 [Ardenticatenaceae bacterium]|nr:hypothetical protein [Anaerolineales bacterium]MCB8979035.1 hypothetical protein [Ardenticatenaceae bacterium]